MKHEEDAAWDNAVLFLSNLHNSDKTIQTWQQLKQEEMMEKLKLHEEVYAPNYEIQQLNDEEFELFFTDVCESDEAYSAYHDMINYELSRREKLHE